LVANATAANARATTAITTKISPTLLNSGTVGVGETDVTGLGEADVVGLGDGGGVGLGDVYVIEESGITDTVVLLAFDTKISFVPES